MLQISHTRPAFKNRHSFYSSIAQPNSVNTRIYELKNSRISDPSMELERLSGNSFVNKRLSKIRECYHSQLMGFNELYQIAYGHSLELFEKLRDDHYVFTHGQCGSCMLGVTILNGVLLEARNSKPLLPFQVALGESSQFEGVKLRPAAWYKENIVPGNGDRNYKDFILCADVRVLSMAQAESALSFFLGFGDRDSPTKEKLISALALKMLPGDASAQAGFIGEFGKLDTEIIDLDRSGSLFTICIPKEHDFNDYGYLARPCGFVFERQGNVDDLLAECQNEEDLSKEPLYDYSRPQVRLVRNKLYDPEVKIFACVVRPDELFESHVEKMRPLVRKYFRGVHSE